jgi:hypothetical protein
MFPSLVALSIQLPLGSVVRAQDVGSVPPMIPGAEEVTSEAPSLVSACLLAVHKHRSGNDWRLGKSFATKSKRWGNIYRIDFSIKGSNLEPLVNRIVCWRKDENGLQIMFAIGQSIPHLGRPK